mmetsp:Transcript_8884/g.13601  ORF Transcript_8884/g.13601 Transcript_8884/m.13601 type:complete len:290 (-) Transcript_8884:1827-2696(-)
MWGSHRTTTKGLVQAKPSGPPCRPPSPRDRQRFLYVVGCTPHLGYARHALLSQSPPTVMWMPPFSSATVADCTVTASRTPASWCATSTRHSAWWSPHRSVACSPRSCSTSRPWRSWRHCCRTKCRSRAAMRCSSNRAVRSLSSKASTSGSFMATFRRKLCHASAAVTSTSRGSTMRRAAWWSSRLCQRLRRCRLTVRDPPWTVTDASFSRRTPRSTFSIHGIPSMRVRQSEARVEMKCRGHQKPKMECGERTAAGAEAVGLGPSVCWRMSTWTAMAINMFSSRNTIRRM